MFNCLPNDPKVTEMNDAVKTWIFYSWIEDRSEQTTLLKNLGCLVGSFWNPEAAKKMLGINDGKDVSVSDEDFEKSIEVVKQYKKAGDKKKRKKISFKEL